MTTEFEPTELQNGDATSAPESSIWSAKLKALRPAKSLSKRIARIQEITKDRWIHYALGDAYLEDFEIVRKTRKQTRTPYRLVYGVPCNGKTMLLKKRYEDWMSSAKGSSSTPALLTEIPFSGSLRKYLNDVMDCMHAGTARPRSMPDLATAALKQMVSCGVEVVLVDEFHHILAARTALEQQHFLNFLKSGLGGHNIAMIAAGTDQSVNLVASDEQIRSRCLIRELPRWEFDENYISLVAGLTEIAGVVEIADLFLNESAASLLLQASGGTIGRTREIVFGVAIEVIQNEGITVDEDLLSHVISQLREMPLE